MSKTFSAFARHSFIENDPLRASQGIARGILLALAIWFAAGALFLATPWGTYLVDSSVTEITR